MGWNEAAELIIQGMESAIEAKQVTYDFARLMDHADEIKCMAFAKEMIKGMQK